MAQARSPSGGGHALGAGRTHRDYTESACRTGVDGEVDLSARIDSMPVGQQLSFDYHDGASRQMGMSVADYSATERTVD